MERARPLLIACAGLFLLAGAYLFGAGGVRAQGANQISAGFTTNGEEYAATLDGKIYARSTASPGNPWSRVITVSVTSSVVDLTVVPDPASSVPLYYVYTADGTVWECDQLRGCTSTNVFTGPVTVQRSTWGQVKTRYR
jgi:hypothetical protein